MPPFPPSWDAVKIQLKGAWSTVHKVGSLGLRWDVCSVHWPQGQQAASCLQVLWALHLLAQPEIIALLDLCAVQRSGCASGV